MAKKNVRNMKVCGQSGYKYETVPEITKAVKEKMHDLKK